VWPQNVGGIVCLKYKTLLKDSMLFFSFHHLIDLMQKFCIFFEPAQYRLTDFSRLNKLTFLAASLYGFIGFHMVKRKVDILFYN
jgi:hypothetical protein